LFVERLRSPGIRAAMGISGADICFARKERPTFEDV
jgi:hypothetical protein